VHHPVDYARVVAAIGNEVPLPPMQFRDLYSCLLSCFTCSEVMPG
jgi:hypothetical protein